MKYFKYTHSRVWAALMMLSLAGMLLFQRDARSSATPYSVFRVTQGKKYRFRLIGGTCTSCPYKFSVGHHTLLIIAVDGTPVDPVRVNSIDIYPGNTLTVGEISFLHPASRK
jgi:FtsP/CotA-like multicopper oxidase with cupredoxin domain